MPLDFTDRFGKLDADRIRQAPSRLLQQTRDRAQAVRHDLYTRRETGRVRLWSLSTEALEKAQEALTSAPEPLSPVTQRLGKAVSEGLEQVTRPPIEGYDDLNVKEIDEAVRALDLVDLERVARYEKAHKDRVTVARSVDREKDRRLAAPAAQA